ncbi:elongation factor 1-gamma-like [Branchiostoma lanceolatum]|uniref:elongation factor 1-gamma-like n=1 Tax=Branchiostoma lanceolatum TaxID=7740 RepID=UPI0034540676
MASGTLYTYPGNFRAYKAQVAAQYSGAQLNVVSDPPAFKLGETNKTPDFLKKFPLGKVPAFEGKDGTCLFESNAIAYYLGNDQLRGTSPKSAALVQQWVNFADSEILPAACSWVYPTLGIMQYNKGNTDQAKEAIKKVLTVLNEYLKTRTFLVDERVSLADISVACNLLLPYQQVLEPAFRQPFVNVNRWFVTCVNQPQFKAALGVVKLCDKMAQFDAKKFAELTPKKDKGGKKEKQPQQPKQEKKKEKKQKEEKEVDEADDLPKEPKSVDPFAALPKSAFNMDEFKRTYSNKDVLTVALPYFWEHFDKEGYSLWYSEYLYQSDLNMIFMTCNLVGGMFQRLEKLRKNAFANVCIFGQDKNNQIAGVWLMRGQELAFPLSSDWTIDYESYSWRKLDPDSEETKLLVKEFWAGEGDFKIMGDRKFNQDKCYK